MTEHETLKKLLSQKKFSDVYSKTEPMLRASPKDPDLLGFKGMALYGLKRADEALKVFEFTTDQNLPLAMEPALCFSQCLLEKERIQDAEMLLGQLLLASPKDPRPSDALVRVSLASKNDQALLMYFARALASQSVTESTLNLVINALKQRKSWNTLSQTLGMILGFFPDRADLWKESATAHLEARRLGPARACIKISLAFKQDPSLYKIDSDILIKANRFDEAIVQLKKGLESAPKNIELCTSLAVAQARTGHNKEAIKLLESLDEEQLLENRAVLTTLCQSYAKVGLANKALAFAEKVIAKAPEAIESYDYKALILAICQQHDKAITYLEGKLEKYAEPPLRLFNRYLSTLMQYGKCEKAFEVSGKYLEDHPDHYQTHIQRGFAALNIRNFEDGWKEYSWRMKIADQKRYFISHPGKVWDEKPMDGTLLLIAEQGMGDVMMASRLFPVIRKMVGRLVIEVQAPLVEFMRHNFPDCEFYARNTKLPPYDRQLQMMEILRIGKVTDKNMPHKDGYLNWQGGFDFTKTKDFTVAVNWRGEPNHPNDANRSMPFASMEPVIKLNKTPGIRIISLQRGTDENSLDSVPWGKDVLKLGGKVKNFCDSAAIANKTDLIISCDSAPVHLFGAMGRPAWVMLNQPAEWRWEQEREDSYWYSSVSTKRISRDDYSWDKLAERIAKDVQTMAKSHKP